MTKGKHLFLYKDRLFVLWDKVYSPEGYGMFFEEHMLLNPDERVLDLCTGCGFFPVLMADKASRIVGVELDPRSARCARANVLLNDISNVEILEGNLFDPVLPQERFDLIISWPPEFPTTPEKRRRDWIGRTTDGGEDGRKLIDETILNASRFLCTGGRLQILHAWYANIPRSIELLSSLGFEAAVTADTYFPLGQISYERADHLAKIGFPPIEKDGELMQYHAVVTGWWRK